MAETRPRSGQLRFILNKSDGTAVEHNLDTYLEDAALGDKTLKELFDQIFDASGNSSASLTLDTSGDPDMLKFALGSGSASDITPFFNITGDFNSSTTYRNLDIITAADADHAGDLYIVHGLSTPATGTITFLSEALMRGSANTKKLIDTQKARDWAIKTDGPVEGSEYSAKYWATSTNVTTVATNITNINTVATDIASVNTVASNIGSITNKMPLSGGTFTGRVTIDNNTSFTDLLLKDSSDVIFGTASEFFVEYNSTLQALRFGQSTAQGAAGTGGFWFGNSNNSIRYFQIKSDEIISRGPFRFDLNAEIKTDLDSLTLNPNADGAANTGTVIIKGDLQVEGTTTTINSTTVSIDDLTFVIAADAASAAASDGAGINIAPSGANVSFTWDNTNSRMSLNTALQTTGNVNGRNMATDGAKLDLIEANADVTGAANVQSAGALMDSELASEASVKALNQDVSTTGTPTFASVQAPTFYVPNNSGDGISFEGSTNNDFETSVKAVDPTADRAILFPDAGGTVITTGNLGDITGLSGLSSSLIFEGSTDDDFETALTVVNPTQDNIITLPDATGTVLLNIVEDTTPQLGGNLDANGYKIQLDNTHKLQWTTNAAATYIQGNSSTTHADSYIKFFLKSGNNTTSGAMVLESTGIMMPTATDIRFEGSTADNFETILTVTDPTADRTVTFPDSTGTVLVVASDGTNGQLLSTNGSGTLSFIDPPSTYTLPIASSSTLGGIKVGSNLTINAATGVLDADQQAPLAGTGIDVAGDKTVSVNLTELTASTTNADGNFFITTNAANNAQVRLTKANIALSGFNNDLANASTSASGLMSNTDKTALDTLNGIYNTSSGTAYHEYTGVNSVTSTTVELQIGAQGQTVTSNAVARSRIFSEPVVVASTTFADLKIQAGRDVIINGQNNSMAGNFSINGNLNLEEDHVITFEGATDNSFETTLTVTDPTADRTITLPDATGTVALTTSTVSNATNATKVYVTDPSPDTDASHFILGVASTGSGNKDVVVDGGVVFNPSTNRLTSAAIFLTGSPTGSGYVGFEGSTTDTYETFLYATDPSADRAIYLPDAGGTLAILSAAQDFTQQQTFSAGQDIDDGQSIGWGGGSSRPAISGDKSNNTMSFYTGGSERLTLANDHLTLTGNIRGPATFTIDPASHGDNTGTVVIAGNLQVDGTTTTINSTTLDVDDALITIAKGAANAAAASGAGINIEGANINFRYENQDNRMELNRELFVYGNSSNGELSYVSISNSDTGGDDIRLQGPNANISHYDTSSVTSGTATYMGGTNYYGQITSTAYHAYAQIKPYIIEPLDSNSSGKKGALHFGVSDGSLASSTNIILKVEPTGIDVTGDAAITSGTNAKLTINDAISEVGTGNLALQTTNSAGSALKPMGFRAENIRFATGSSERVIINDDGLGVGMTPDSAVELSVSGAIGPTNGSASAPTHTFYSDPDTGMFRTASNILGFTAGGTEYVQIGSFGVAADTLTNKTASADVIIDAAGGIILDADDTGTISLKDNADRYGVFRSSSGTFTIQAMHSSNNNLTYQGDVHTFDNAAGSTEYMRVTSTGLGIGSDPSFKLDVGHVSSGAIQARFKSSGDTGYTQGAILLESSDSSNTPSTRGQGVFMFNHGNDRTWYSGTTYAGSGNFAIGTGTGTSLNTAAADNGAYAMLLDTSKNAFFAANLSAIGSYHEFGNGYGSVSNDGGWNGRLNVAGTSHARIDAVSVSDGIVTTMYAHTGQGAGRVGTMSDHHVIFMTGGNQRAELNTNGNFTANAEIRGTHLRPMSGSNGGPAFSYGNNGRNIYLTANDSGNVFDVGQSFFSHNGNWTMQLYGFNNGSTQQYGFLDANWSSWDIQKTPSGNFLVDEGGGLKRVLNEGNYASQISSLNDVQFTGLYVGATNTSYDFYNNGTSYFNGTTTIDDLLSISSTAEEKIRLTGATSPYIMFQSGTSSKAFVQWENSQNALRFKNQASDNFQFVTHDNTGALQIRLMGSDNDSWGSIYATDSQHIGFLDEGGNWAYRIENDSQHVWEITGSTQMNLTTSKLDLQGNNLEGVTNIKISDVIYHTGDTDTYIYFQTDQINIETGGTARVIADNNGVRLGDSGNGYFRPVSGQYGSIEIDGGNHGGWEGYSIGGRAVFMHDNSSTTGIYDDDNNNWLFEGIFGGEARMYHNGTQKIAATSAGCTVAGAVTATSDIRYKKNIEKIDDALDKVKSLRGVTFEWNDDKLPVGYRSTGVIAQEVEAVLPEAVTDNSDGYKSVAYGNMVGLLIEAIKEQQEQIDELKKELGKWQ